MPTPTSGAEGQTPAWFATTHWSVVLAAGRDGSPESALALSSLCQAYWRPLYAFVRRLGHEPADAEDLTQEFFARVIDKNYLDAADPCKGRFRTFLITVLKRFLANEWDKANRLKRGGGRELISLDARDLEDRFVAEPAHEETPERMFDRRWAMTLLDRVLNRLDAEFEAAGKQALFELLKSFLVDRRGESSYAELAAKSDMNVSALKVSVFRLRQRYRELVREEIALTVGSSREIDDELNHLFAALSN